MSERRYNEEEVAAIFAAAADPQSSVQRRPGAAGMTLAELQEIAAEVGLSQHAVARAAASLHTPAQVATRRFLGLPIAVSRTAELGRELSESEWERLVVDLR